MVPAMLHYHFLQIDIFNTEWKVSPLLHLFCCWKGFFTFL